MSTLSLLILSIIPIVPIYAWNMSLAAPPEIVDPAFQFPAFGLGNDQVVLNKTIGRLPALGWNSWNAYADAIDEGLIKSIGSAFITLGLDKAGYEYVVIDDGCYPVDRVDGRLTNNEKFSSGFKSMSDFIRGLGLKFGMYNCVGLETCAGQAGLYGNEDIDAQSFAEWGVDFLKVDYCTYPWDIGWNSLGAPNQQYVYAPRIRSMTLSGGGLEAPVTLTAVADGIFINNPQVDRGNFVSRLGTDMSKFTNHFYAHQNVHAPHWRELGFKVDVPSDGTYDMVINYSTGSPEFYDDETSNSVYDDTIFRQGAWLQVAVGPVENEKRFFDNSLPITDTTASGFTFQDSQIIKVGLKTGPNLIRLMNHRREENALYSYAAFLDGLNKAGIGKSMVLSVCDWGQTRPYNWANKVGDSWRTSDDIAHGTVSASWGSGPVPSVASVMGQFAKNVILDEYAGLTRGWNDPDMMVIGMQGIDHTMAKSHMALWCMMNSPIMLGFDLTNSAKWEANKDVVLNTDFLALNQDELGVQSKRVYSSLSTTDDPSTEYISNTDRLDILAKPLANGDVALMFINCGSGSNGGKSASVDVDTIINYIGHKMADGDGSAFRNAESYSVTDLWSKLTTTDKSRIFSVNNLGITDSYVIRITPIAGSPSSKADASLLGHLVVLTLSMLIGFLAF